ncbi:MAG: hypothetical protein ABJC33_07110 [Betaproteobacteria bacterium]
MTPHAATGRAFTRGEWIALLLALAIAHGFFWHLVRYPSDYDARNYLDIAADIARNGLFGKFYYSDIRTYGYPLFLSVLMRGAAVTGTSWAWWIFETQLLLFVGAAVAVRQAIAARYPAVAPVVFIALVLNVFALSYAPESLTESLSLSLILFGVACWIRLRDATSPHWRVAFLGSLILAAAVMVRPASLFAIGAWYLAVAAVCVVRRISGLRAASIVMAVVAGSVLPLIPQYVNNVRHYGEHTPLVVAELARNQQRWGIEYLKYATAMPPVPNPSIFYQNPLAAGRPIEESRPLQWYLDYPVAGAATMALHVFNLLDQDLFFTYSRDLDPWYRVPLGVLTHGGIALALAGAAMLALRRRGEGTVLTLFAIGAFVLAHLGLHATTAVEMRFGLPLLVLGGPLATWAVIELRSVATRRAQWVAAPWVVLYVVIALMLSGWVRQQAPSIRAWQAAQAQISGQAAR